ncbi:hypothetical protein DBR28_13925 [Chryseobacterium sp. HMWF028]|nr:hypothetical protein DBR28_13925 [Chryseobacterium sp. HMWF028]
MSVFLLRYKNNCQVWPHKVNSELLLTLMFANFYELVSYVVRKGISFSKEKGFFVAEWNAIADRKIY